MHFKNSIKILIRVLSHKKFGFGHLSRCVAIRNQLNISASWFVDPGDKRWVSKLLPSSDEIFEEKTFFGLEETLKKLNTKPNQVLLIDNKKIYLHSLKNINTNFLYFSECQEHLKSRKKNLTIINTQPLEKSVNHHLTGVKYISVNKTQNKNDNINFQNITFPVNCLISFGAIDSKNITCLALNAIKRDKDLNEKIMPIVLIGKDYRFLEAVKKITNKSKALILSGYKSILEIEKKCPIAIGAPGVSHAERLYSGIATVLVSKNKEHLSLMKAWESQQCCLYANPNEEDIACKLKFLIKNNFNIAKKISFKGKKIVDGLGANRIAQKILKLYQ